MAIKIESDRNISAFDSGGSNLLNDVAAVPENDCDGMEALY